MVLYALDVSTIVKRVVYWALKREIKKLTFLGNLVEQKCNRLLKLNE